MTQSQIKMAAKRARGNLNDWCARKEKP